MISNDKTVQFKQQFDLLSKNTKEYDITVPYIVSHIVDKLPQRDHFIDVGAGRGNLAKPLSAHFKHTTIIEPNQHFYHEVLDWALHHRRNMSGVSGTWRHAQVDKADCILLSHVLYYVPRQTWMPFVAKAYDSLNPGGSIIIILNQLSNGVTDLYHHFLEPNAWWEIASAEGMQEALLEADYPLQSVNFRSFIRADTAHEAHELIDFLLLGRATFDTPEKQQKRVDYTETYLKHGGRYAINSNCSLITVTKPLE
ncbi:MAG: class I SAM-dependent methyltransferase [Anaerolineae bacterium]|nr:class I SAM-dependent methyltransferase [Anaerolineae bacterium]MDQ7034486.1 class I SAM-dependent methyltransferase [Anaerolineae bacterium]